MKKALFVLLLLGLAGGYIYWPYYTVAKLEDAFRSADQQALEQLIDFAAVRQSLKEQMKAKVAAEAPENPAAPEAGAKLATAILTGVVADRVVDSMVTPGTIAKFLKLEAAIGSSAKMTLHDKTWHSLSEFSAKAADGSQFNFRRRGMEGWKVVSIEPGNLLGRQVQIPR